MMSAIRTVQWKRASFPFNNGTPLLVPNRWPNGYAVYSRVLLLADTGDIGFAGKDGESSDLSPCSSETIESLACATKPATFAAPGPKFARATGRNINPFNTPKTMRPTTALKMSRIISLVLKDRQRTPSSVEVAPRKMEDPMLDMVSWTLWCRDPVES